MPERTRAALSLLECMTRRPLELDAGLVQSLRDRGLDERAICTVACVAFRFNFINRMADAFDFDIPNATQTARISGVLNWVGRRAKSRAMSTDWTRRADGRIVPTAVHHGREHLLTTPGRTEPALRRAVEGFVCQQWGVERPDAPTVAEELVPYLSKLALYAYKIVDDDIEALRAAGYGDERIFEITMVGSFAASSIGLEQLFGALHGDQAVPASAALS